MNGELSGHGSQEPAVGRWAQLFADLEAQWEAEHRRDLEEEVADRTRHERAGIGLVDRLAAVLDQGPPSGRSSPGGPRRRPGVHAAAARTDGSVVGVRLLGGPVLRGELQDVGAGWLLLAEGSHRTALVPFTSIGAVHDLTPRAGSQRRGRQFGFGYALRGLSRDRAVVQVLDRGGHTSVGTIDGVGADAFDLSEHPADLARRTDNVSIRSTVPFSAVSMVRST